MHLKTAAAGVFFVEMDVQSPKNLTFTILHISVTHYLIRLALFTLIAPEV